MSYGGVLLFIFVTTTILLKSNFQKEVVEKEVVASTSETSEPVPKKKKSDLASMFAQAASQVKPKQSVSYTLYSIHIIMLN